MPPLSEDYSDYWAPEVTYREGKFYLYYSAGDGSRMHLRIALGDAPGGPFTDCGIRLTSEEFAIDPHVFEDDDGQCWLFYATDFLEHTHVGTGTVRDRMIDPFTLSGNPSPVVRAQYGWQLFDPERKEKGGVRWHTVEGPTVLKRKGLYYEMFSGGNWKNASYGVGYAVSTSIQSQDEWRQVCDGTRVFPLLQSAPGVTGPGHNSVVRGPDNRHLYCVYHQWDAEVGRRVLSIDPLEWIGEELSVFGPTTKAQPAPNLPRIGSLERWKVTTGDWSFATENSEQRSLSGYSEVRYDAPVDTGFLVECDARALRGSSRGALGIFASDAGGSRHWASLLGSGLNLSPQFEVEPFSDSRETVFSGSFRLVRLEASGFTLKASIGNLSPRHRVVLKELPQHIGLFTNDLAGEFQGFSLTRGWQDSFEDADDCIAALAFQAEAGAWQVHSMALHQSEEPSTGVIFKFVPAAAYDFVINARLEGGSRGFYGFFPASPLGQRGPLVGVVPRAGSWILCLDKSGYGDIHTSSVLAVLPSGFDIYEYQQFGFTVDDDVMAIRWRGTPLCEAAIGYRGVRVGLFAAGRASFEMVRVTELVAT